MTLAELDAVCMTLPAVTMVVQWGDANVYKVGGKVFANATEEGVSFKASEIAYEALVEQGRGRKAPYTSGGHWLHMGDLATLDGAEVAGLMADAHAIIAAKLTKVARRELGL